MNTTMSRMGNTTVMDTTCTKDEKYKKDHLLFLHNKNVPATNNEAERLLRKYKRKQAQAVSFRSPSSIDHLCKCMSMLVLMRRKEQTNLFREIAEIFA